MNDVFPLANSTARSLPSGETASDLIWPEELLPYDKYVRRNRKNNPPFKTLSPKLSLIAMVVPFREEADLLLCALTWRVAHPCPDYMSLLAEGAPLLAFF